MHEAKQFFVPGDRIRQHISTELVDAESIQSFSFNKFIPNLLLFIVEL